MSLCYFVSDLHGKMSRYKSLFKSIENEKPTIVFIGGDILPMQYKKFNQDLDESEDFLQGYIIKHFKKLKEQLREDYPMVCIILGNDDQRINEPIMIEAEKLGLWQYMHNRKIIFNGFAIYGYSCVPPTPFRLKDWEKYDVSRYVDPGCISPLEGFRSVNVHGEDYEWETIQKDLVKLTIGEKLNKSIFLFHSPPYQTKLDRAALDGMYFDSIPLDVNVGSIAIKRFIEERQPYLTLHGHIHESAKITGDWKDQIYNTLCFNAAHDGAELSLIKFDINNIHCASRQLI